MPNIFDSNFNEKFPKLQKLKDCYYKIKKKENVNEEVLKDIYAEAVLTFIQDTHFKNEDIFEKGTITNDLVMMIDGFTDAEIIKAFNNILNNKFENSKFINHTFTNPLKNDDLEKYKTIYIQFSRSTYQQRENRSLLVLSRTETDAWTLDCYDYEEKENDWGKIQSLFAMYYGNVFKEIEIGTFTGFKKEGKEDAAYPLMFAYVLASGKNINEFKATREKLAFQIGKDILKGELSNIEKYISN